MTNPYQQGSSNLSDPSSPTFADAHFRRHPYASMSGYRGPPGRHTRGSIISQLLNNDESNHTTYAEHNRGADTQQHGVGSGGIEHFWTSSAMQYPPYSKAFDTQLNDLGQPGINGTDDDTGFFVPSYLQGSAYVQKLELAHMMMLQKQRDAQQTGNPTAVGHKDGGHVSLTHTKSASYRGISHHVVEKPPQEMEGPASPLPSRWNKDDKFEGLEVLQGGLEVRYLGVKMPSDREREHEAYSIRADHPMPAQAGIYYFEVHILGGKRDDTTIGVGFSAKSVSLSRPPGWEPDSWGYHGDDGNCYAAHSGGKSYGPSFTVNDVIGCGINFRTKSAFYTRNGVFLGAAFKDVKGKLYPSVGLKKSGEHVRVNFGQAKFVFDIDAMVKREKARIHADIAQADTSKLSPLNERDLVQSLVLQFLQHDGYIETARAFAEEIRDERRALSLDPSAAIEDIDVRDDEHAAKRQRIRRAVLEGDIELALRHTNAFYPEVLPYHENVHFKLRCRKFIEMVRSAAEMRAAAEGKMSNGHTSDRQQTQGMDLDLNGSGNGISLAPMESSVAAKPPVGIEELELQTLTYGQSLQDEYSDDPRREVTEALADIYALLAYTNPLKAKDVAHLLDKKGRVAVAEELNSAILLSLGKSSRAALDEVYAQTTVLLDDLRENGGAGSFVSLQDVMDEVP